MELSDYIAAIRRHWPVWVLTMLVTLGLSIAGLVVTPKTYQAEARIFVSAQPSIPNSAQYVTQRAQSYPDVVTSASVLSFVIDQLGLHETVPQLMPTVTATVPTGTSQIDISVSASDPRRAADIANAVAQTSTKVIEQLETHPSGTQPVTLTVSNPASVPSAPTSPKPVYYLLLGLFAGLFGGLALTVARSQTSARVYDEKDVRRAWGAERGLDVLAPQRGRARRSALTGNVVAALARRIGLIAEERRVRLAVLSPAPSQGAAAEGFAAQLTEELRSQGLAVDQAQLASRAGTPGVTLAVADPLAPPLFWHSAAQHFDGVVLVVPSGRVAKAEVQEMRVLLRAAGVEVVAIVVTRRSSRRSTPPAGTPLPPVASQVRNGDGEIHTTAVLARQGAGRGDDRPTGTD